jgi:hypothetical protein
VPTEEKLRNTLVEFFHREIDRRYSYEYLKEMSDVRADEVGPLLETGKLQRIKDFFKRVMYPAGKDRELRDAGMETVASIIGSASSLLGLLPRLAGVLVAHTMKIPEISAAAMELVSAYRLANALERRTLNALEEICAENGVDPGAADEIPDEFLRHAYASISDEEIRQMVRRTGTIVRLGMKQDLMKATRDITEKVMNTRASADERRALAYIVSELDEVLELAPTFSKHDRETIVRLSEHVERNYFAELRRAYESPA